MLKWEKDLGQSFTDTQWLDALKLSLRASQASNLHELVHKFTLRWYVTPHCTTFYGNAPGYPIFWRSIFQLVAEVTKVDTKPMRALALLGTGLDNFHPHTRCIA